MQNVPPVVRIDADDDVITIEHHACTVPLTFAEARQVRDSLTELLATCDETERDGEVTR